MSTLSEQPPLALPPAGGAVGKLRAQGHHRRPEMLMFSHCCFTVCLVLNTLYWIIECGQQVVENIIKNLTFSVETETKEIIKSVSCYDLLDRDINLRLPTQMAGSL